MEGNRKIIYTSHYGRKIRGNHSRIGSPGVNEEVCSPRSDTTSNVLGCTDNVEKFDTLVHGSTTKESNLESSRIKEVGVKSIFPELGKDPDSSVQVNLTKSVLGNSPKFISLGHPAFETADIRNIGFASSTRAKNLNGFCRGTERDDSLGYTHDFETMSKTKTYCNHIKNSEIENREVFERETSSLTHPMPTRRSSDLPPVGASSTQAYHPFPFPSATCSISLLW